MKNKIQIAYTKVDCGTTNGFRGRRKRINNTRGLRKRKEADIMDHFTPET